MPRKKSSPTPEIIPQSEVTIQPITDTIEQNYMPYVMSVIISRALPEIDGFKPSHRKLLYTMYKMGLLTSQKTKSANVVGQTMKLNPHGDASIYETLVRLTRGHQALLHPFVDSKGTFGKHYSKNTAYAASRYTEVKLDTFCNELFRGIDKNAVDMTPNYDNTMEEPVLLPTTFPNILLSPNLGIAVGMACSICSFNLAELCDGTIALLKNPKITTDKMMEIIKAPDFPGGAQIIYERDKMKEVFETGYGSIRMRARYSYDKANNSLDILQIPYSTTIEAVIDKITDLINAGKLKEIADIRDAMGLNSGKLINIDLRRGVDPDKLMAKLYKVTTLEDNFDCNFNILVNGTPKQLGVVDILREWITFRIGCVQRELAFDLQKKKDKHHLLLGLAQILLDIDKAIRIIRNTEKEEDVVPNLMEGFSITQVQAEYIAEIKLRHLNREYIMKRVSEIEELQREIAELEEILRDELKIKAYIAKQLQEIKKKYGQPRKTQLIGADELIEADTEELVENYNVRLVMTHDGYFKKITMQSLRGNDEQKLKEGDYVVYSEDTDNRGELIFFTNRCQVYKAKVADFDQQKASALGDYLPAKLKMDNGEYPIMAKMIYEYNPKHNVIFIFENGKGLKVPITAYETKAARKKLTSAYSSSCPIVAAVYEEDTIDIGIINDQNKGILISSSLIPMKASKTSSGSSIFTLKKEQKIVEVVTNAEGLKKLQSCRKRKIPTTGSSI